VLNPAANPSGRRPPRSLRAEYQEFIDQRIEEYKDSLARADILGIGDEAMQELQGADQLQLTEVVLRDQVDAIIRRRLRLPSFRRWRERHLTLRTAQQQPGHWGLSAHDPVALLADLIEDQDPVLLIGVADGACALFLAARGAFVTCCDPDIAAIYGLEGRAVVEQLGGRIDCRVERLEYFSPQEGGFVACVIETGAVAYLDAHDREALIGRLKTASRPHSRHAIMPGHQGADGTRLASDALRSHYGDWTIEKPHPAGRKARNNGFLATNTRPGEVRHSDTPDAVSH
jgi:hypothetical protein